MITFLAALALASPPRFQFIHDSSMYDKRSIDAYSLPDFKYLWTAEGALGPYVPAWHGVSAIQGRNLVRIKSDGHAIKVIGITKAASGYVGRRDMWGVSSNGRFFCSVGNNFGIEVCDIKAGKWWHYECKAKLGRPVDLSDPNPPAQPNLARISDSGESVYFTAGSRIDRQAGTLDGLPICMRFDRANQTVSFVGRGAPMGFIGDSVLLDRVEGYDSVCIVRKGKQTKLRGHLQSASLGADGVWAMDAPRDVFRVSRLGSNGPQFDLPKIGQSGSPWFVLPLN